MNKVLCLIETFWSDESEYYDSQDAWLDLEPRSRYSYISKQNIIPLIDHPHSDVENGQKEIHYHVNTKYESSKSYNSRISLPLKKNQKLEYRYVNKIRNDEISKTSVKLIKYL